MRRAPRTVAFPRMRAPILFGALALLFAGLIARSVWLQSINKEFLQDQGSSRYARSLEIPAHRGRITDRHGTPLAISTPVKSIWVFAGRVESEPAQLAALARLLELDSAALKQSISADSGGHSTL